MCFEDGGLACRGVGELRFEVSVWFEIESLVESDRWAAPGASQKVSSVELW